MRLISCVVVFGIGMGLAVTPTSAGESLPYYDIRLQADGKPAAFVTQAKQAAVSARQKASRQAAEKLIGENVKGVRIDEHEFFATPHYIGSTDQFLTGPAQGTLIGQPRLVARQFVADRADLFHISPVELDNARVERDFVSDHNGVTHLTLQQQINGIDLFGCEVLANVSPRGELINISSTMLPRPAGDFAPIAPVLSPLDALRAAAASIGIQMTADPSPLAGPDGVNRKQTWQNTPDFRADERITTELIYFPLTQTDIRPAWSLLVPEIGIGNTYEMMVDATNGQILRRWNRLHDATTEAITMRVYTDDDPAPGTPGNSTPVSTQFPFVARSLVTVNPADVPYSTINVNGWINDGVNETSGNNVHSHLDLSNTNPSSTGGVAGSSYRVFDFPLEPASPPYDITVAPSNANARNAAVTQLFYLCNIYHDRLWSLGFKENSKNFQLDNYGRGGTANDRVQADCQDGGGTNNANFSTSGSDGSSARMQMYIFTGPNPDRDGSLDSNIVYHEYSHGLSIRLSNGTVNGEQSGGMGEGWGDYFALSINAQPSDDPHGVYPMGGFATYQLSGLTSNYYFGIRRFPYSTDMTKNPETFADIDPTQISFPPAVPISPIFGVGTANEVHNVGEIWCTTLIECRANLWDQHGFSGNERMMQLVVDGLKLQVANPNMLQARDGILQADTNDYAGADLCLLWKAFAKRGMGPLATSPSGSTATGVVESYALLQFAYPDGLPTQLQPGTPTSFHVNVSGIVAAVTPTTATGQLYYSVNGGAFSSVAMSSVGTNQYLATLPTFNCFDTVRYYVSSDSCAGVQFNPATAPENFTTATVFTSSVSAFADDFEANLGWVAGAPGDTATTGVWTRVNPVGTLAQPEDDHTSGAGVTCFVTGQGVVGGGLGDNDVDGGITTLTSPTINLSAYPDAKISYWRWYSNNTGATPGTDTFLVDISTNNGSSWTSAEIVGPSGADTIGGWIFHEFTLSSLGLSPTATVKIRFIAQDLGAGSLVEAAVDDFAATGIDCVPVISCLKGDVNNDSKVDGLDVQRYTDILVNGGGTPLEICAGDVGPSPNSAIDDTDTDNFVTCVLNEGCP